MKQQIKNRCLGLAILAIATMAHGQGQPALVFNPLPYAADALEPHIDTQTMEIHYGKHHQGYFNNLVKAVTGTPLEGQPVESLLPAISQYPATVRNNGGGHWNHTFFWKSMAPQAGGEPGGTLGAALQQTFGSFDEFKKQFEAAALSRFGSGWAWLNVGADGSLFISSTPNQDNPLMDVAEKRGIPLLGLDVWEHAYYLKYQNLRASYVQAFWNVVNWPEIANRYAAAKP